ncbi:hypothetical protein LINGRAPRIM_LOCUS385 [Linum grandiflorum]
MLVFGRCWSAAAWNMESGCFCYDAASLISLV